MDIDVIQTFHLVHRYRCFKSSLVKNVATKNGTQKMSKNLCSLRLSHKIYKPGNSNIEKCENNIMLKEISVSLLKNGNRQNNCILNLNFVDNLGYFAISCRRKYEVNLQLMFHSLHYIDMHSGAIVSGKINYICNCALIMT